jgi:hypothetical protein
MKKKVYNIESMTIRDMCRTYKISRSTAWRGKRRGWIYVNYHKKEINTAPISSLQSDFPEVGYQIAKAVFYRFFYWRAHSIAHIEDLLQESILRMLELSGRWVKHPNYKLFLWKIAHNAQRDYLKKWYKGR